MDKQATRVIVTALSSEAAIQPLALDLLQAGCYFYHIFFLTHRLGNVSGVQSDRSNLCRLGIFRRFRLWGVRQAPGLSMKTSAKQRLRANGIRLLSDLFRGDSPLNWTTCQSYLNNDCLLIVVQLPSIDTVEPVLTRCVLNHATDRLHVFEIPSARIGHSH